MIFCLRETTINTNQLQVLLLHDQQAQVPPPVRKLAEENRLEEVYWEPVSPYNMQVLSPIQQMHYIIYSLSILQNLKPAFL